MVKTKTQSHANGADAVIFYVLRVDNYGENASAILIINAEANDINGTNLLRNIDIENVVSIVLK